MGLVNFNVLMVCSGNLCRSPIAEQLLRAQTNGYSIRVTSAGTIADEGKRMPNEAAAVSRRYGGDPSAHLSRLLTAAHLDEADLVLAATRAHRGAVVQMAPRMSRQTFTIREFARLASSVPEADWYTLPDSASVVDAVRRMRGFVAPPEDPAHDDLEDPYRQPVEFYEAVGAEIHTDISFIAKVLSVPGMD